MAKRVKDDKDIPLGADVTPSAPQPPLKKRKSVTGTAVAAAAVETVASAGQNHTAQGAEDTASKRGPTTGVILRSGRIRLPDKLMQYLNNGVAPESLFWQEDCQGFSINCDRVQKELLDKYFHGTKLSSFLRSMNRWGFKRLFYHSMPKSTLSFHHPLFRKDDPDLSKEMNMAPCSSSSGGSSSGAATKDSKKKAAKESSPPPPPQPKQAPAPLAAPSSVQEPAVAVASVAPAPVVAAPAPPVAAAPAAVAPAPTSAFVQTIAGGLAGQLRDQTAIQNAAKELLLKQAIANSQQQQQQQTQQQQKQQLEQSMLLQQAIASAQQHQQQQHQRQPSLENANAVIQQAVAAIQQKQQQDATNAILQHVLSSQGNTNISNNVPSSVLLSTILDAAQLTQTVPSPAPQAPQPQVQLQLQQLQLHATGTQPPQQPLQLQIQPATAAQLQQLAQAQVQAQQQVNTASSGSQANTATTTATAPSNQLATLASALASGRLNLSSTTATPAPAPTPATSVSQQLQLLTPEQQLALLTQVSANRPWSNPN